MTCSLADSELPPGSLLRQCGMRPSQLGARGRTMNHKTTSGFMQYHLHSNCVLQANFAQLSWTTSSHCLRWNFDENRCFLGWGRLVRTDALSTIDIHIYRIHVMWSYIFNASNQCHMLYIYITYMYAHAHHMLCIIRRLQQKAFYSVLSILSTNINIIINNGW